MDSSKSTRLETVIEWTWAVCGFALAAWAHLAFACGAFHVEPFDGALMFLQPLYAARGLTPYLDFGFTYPPGATWFFGDLLRCTSIQQVLISTAVLNLVLVSICAFLIAILSSRRKWVGVGSVYFCLGWLIPMLEMRLSGDLCSISLCCLVLLLIVAAVLRPRSKVNWPVLLLAAFVITVWRWDRLIVLVSILIGLSAFALTLGLIVTQESTRLRHMACRILLVSAISLAGIVAAVAVMATVSILNHSFQRWRDFVFVQPSIVLPYRALPIPRPIGEDGQWLYDTFAILLLLAAAWFAGFAGRKRPSWNSVLVGVVLVAAPLSLLPYTFHRADVVHFLPLSASIMTASLAGLAVWKGASVHRLLVLAVCLVIFPGLEGAVQQGVLQGVIPRTGLMSQEMQNLTQECSSLIPSGAHTLFVGQATYGHFLVNMPIFYLANPNLSPATAFIAEEPGIENSCKYGSQIAADLDRAERPTAVLLDNFPWHHEPNLSSNLHDCGKISSELSALRLNMIGSCKIGPRDFQVGLIR